LVEVSTLARACRHPHLIGYLGWARSGRELWSVSQPVPVLACHWLVGCAWMHWRRRLVLEHAKQGSLFDLVASEAAAAAQQGGAAGAVGLPRLLRMMAGAAAGLMHLHACDPPIIHRDIALRNLFVQSGDHVKASLLLSLLLVGWRPGLVVGQVGDLGMARMLQSHAAAAATVAQLGPVQWMSPEALLKGEYSRASDVYMFGATLFELLTRRPPFAGTLNHSLAH